MATASDRSIAFPHNEQACSGLGEEDSWCSHILANTTAINGGCGLHAATLLARCQWSGRRRLRKGEDFDVEGWNSGCMYMAGCSSTLSSARPSSLSPPYSSSSLTTPAPRLKKSGGDGGVSYRRRLHQRFIRVLWHASVREREEDLIVGLCELGLDPI
ncbi:hypothetical protein Cni_G02188 [Canna indica]|uniref:Uncharacterized protein n=1 Tax=Canna indica TaxID=4628 RepID=A0AAQ3Q1Y2_9LILI|nr:hypothetical protein Cni_G02188 [Canna indica]